MLFSRFVDSLSPRASPLVGDVSVAILVLGFSLVRYGLSAEGERRPYVCCVYNIGHIR